MLTYIICTANTSERITRQQESQTVNLIAAESKQRHAGEKLAEQTKHKILLSRGHLQVKRRKLFPAGASYSGYDGSHGHPM